MTSRLIHDMPGLLDVVRARRDELDISFETLDFLAGFPTGYAAKLLAPTPVRGIAYMSLTGLLGALGLAIVVVEDAAAAERMRRNWTPRKRRKPGCVVRRHRRCDVAINPLEALDGNQTFEHTD